MTTAVDDDLSVVECDEPLSDWDLGADLVAIEEAVTRWRGFAADVTDVQSALSDHATELTDPWVGSCADAYHDARERIGRHWSAAAELAEQIAGLLDQGLWCLDDGQRLMDQHLVDVRATFATTTEGLPIDHDGAPDTPEVINPNQPLPFTNQGLCDEMGTQNPPW